MTLQDFQMPVPSAGTPVLWYRSGIKTSKKPEVVFVLSVGNRSIRARTAYGELLETVRHVADPKLDQSKDQRESGAWDFTEDHYRRAAWTADVEGKLKALETKLSKLLVGSIREESSDDYRGLVQEARDLGLQFRGNPSRKKLEQMIREVKENADASAVSSGEPLAGEGRGSEEAEA